MSSDSNDEFDDNEITSPGSEQRAFLEDDIDRDDRDDDDDDSGSDDDDRKDDEEEPASDYEMGGYHPVYIGDVFANRYYIMRKLGWGHFATVWLAYDHQARDFAAIKVPKSRQDFIEASRDELEILNLIYNGNQNHFGYHNVVHVLHEFDFTGVSRSLHLCMVFEVLGDNLLTLLRRFTSLNLNLCRVISKQMLQGLEYLHGPCDVIHTDIKPENVVLCLTAGQLKNLAIEAYENRNNPNPPKNMVSTTPEAYRQKFMQGIPQKSRKKMRRTRKKHRERLAQHLEELVAGNKKVNGAAQPVANGGGSDADSFDNLSYFYEQIQIGSRLALQEVRVKIVDFGNACYTNHHFTEEIQTREYRSPEAILGSEYNASADVWSAACLIFELVTGEYLFYPEAGPDDEYGIDDDHIAKMIEILGPMPNNQYRDGRRWSETFDKNGRLLRIKFLHPTSIVELLMDIAELPGIEARLMWEFLMPMFHYDINKRYTPLQCLRSTWLEIADMRGSPPKRRPLPEEE